MARADLQHGQGGRARADEEGAEHARLLPDLIRGLEPPRLSKKDIRLPRPRPAPRLPLMAQGTRSPAENVPAGGGSTLQSALPSIAARRRADLGVAGLAVAQAEELEQGEDDASQDDDTWARAELSSRLAAPPFQLAGLPCIEIASAAQSGARRRGSTARVRPHPGSATRARASAPTWRRELGARRPAGPLAQRLAGPTGPTS